MFNWCKKDVSKIVKIELTEEDKFLLNIIENIMINPDNWSSIFDNKPHSIIWDSSSKMAISNKGILLKPFDYDTNNHDIKHNLSNLVKELISRDEYLCYGKKEKQIQTNIKECNKLLEDSLPDEFKMQWRRMKKLERILK